MEEQWQDKAVQLTQVRRSLGLRAWQVAQEARMDRSSISAYETLRARPSAHALASWEAALVALAKRCRACAEIALSDLERK